MSFRCQRVFKEGGGGEQFDTVLGERVSHRTEKGFRVAFLEFGQKKEGGEVGSEIEEVFRRDLSGHDRMTGAGFIGAGEKFAELSDA